LLSVTISAFYPQSEILTIACCLTPHAYFTTRTARISTIGGIVKPSTLAVFKLISNSKTAPFLSSIGKPKSKI
jgi:hypothetical protein